MWIFLLSDTFIFSCFLTSLHERADLDHRAVAEPERGVRAATSADASVPLLLIAIMTFVLITSSGTMAMAVNFGYRRDRANTAALMLVTAGLRRHLRRHAGLRVDQADPRRGRAALGQPAGRGAVRLGVLHDHRLSRPARVGRRDLPDASSRCASGRGFYDRKGNYEIVEIAGLYWHFVDLVWVFIFAFFYLW